MSQYPYNQCVQVNFENSWSVRIEHEVLEEGGLDECTALRTLCLFHSHLQAIAAYEASGYLEGGKKIQNAVCILFSILLCL